MDLIKSIMWISLSITVPYLLLVLMYHSDMTRLNGFSFRTINIVKENDSFKISLICINDDIPLTIKMDSLDNKYLIKKKAVEEYRRIKSAIKQGEII